MISIADMAGTGAGLTCRLAVIKLGSAVLIGRNQTIEKEVVGAVADEIARLRKQKVGVILVTSGAIGVGRSALGRPVPKTIPDKQALAAVGQISLMHTYQAVLARRGLQAAQVLLSRDDMNNRQRYLNARYTLERLIGLGAIPIVNENDTTATDEINFGDNDMLSAYLAVKMKADLLILLSIVDGVYRPAGGAEGKSRRELASVIPKVDDEVLGWVEDNQTTHGRGGMGAKLKAARTAGAAGVHTVIAQGKDPHILSRIFSGDFRGTYFPPSRAGAITARRRWIGYGQASHGRRLMLDAGAAHAILEKKKSLLPVGVVKVIGQFKRGDIVDLYGRDGVAIARGLVNYSSAEIEKIKRRKTSEIDSILGYRDYDEIVHRDNMAMV